MRPFQSGLSTRSFSSIRKSCKARIQNYNVNVRNGNEIKRGDTNKGTLDKRTAHARKALFDAVKWDIRDDVPGLNFRDVCLNIVESAPVCKYYKRIVRIGRRKRTGLNGRNSAHIIRIPIAHKVAWHGTEHLSENVAILLRREIP